MPGVLVRVPYIFKATVMRPRKRNADEVGYLGEVDLVVPGIDVEDAPVVLHGVPDTYAPLPPHRFHDGCLWVADTEGRDGKGPVHTVSWLHGDPERDVSYHPLFAKSQEYVEHRHGKAVARDSDANVKESRSDDETAVLARVREKARLYLLVGDEVWKRAPEPVYDISRHLMADDYVGISGFNGGRDQYRLDQGHWIEEIDWSRSGREKGPGRTEVVVLRPDLLRARTTEHSVAWTCKHVVGALYEKMREGTVGDFASYVRLREAERDLAAALERGDPFDLAALATTLSDATDTLERLDRGMDGHGIDYDRKYVDNALGRIERELAMPVHDDVTGFSP